MPARRFASETFTLSGTPPTSTALATLTTALRAADAATRGISIDEAKGVCAVASVNSSKTITSGSLACFVYMPVSINADGSIATRRWVRFASLDVDLINDTDIATDTERDIVTGDQLTLTGAGRVCWLPSSVVGSSDSDTLTVTYVANRF